MLSVYNNKFPKHIFQIFLSELVSKFWTCWTEINWKLNGWVLPDSEVSNMDKFIFYI